MGEFQCLFSPYIERFLVYREALFHRNTAYLPVLKSLDCFCAEQYPNESSLSQEMVLTWMDRSCNLGRLSRGCIVRHFALYMNGIGGTAYVLPEKMYGGDKSFVPYIFTDDELQRLFAAIDKIQPTRKHPFSDYTLPVLFRLIYTCGLRPNEGRLLRKQNIYLDTGEILISETKCSKERIVVMSEDMRTLCADYYENSRFFGVTTDYFFPTTDGTPMPNTFVLTQFRKSWAAANPDISPESLPRVRVYDLRHQFVSATVQKWLDDGSDLNAKLPFLRAYLGHSSISQTAYYLHLLPNNLTASNAVNWAAFDTLLPEVEE